MKNDYGFGDLQYFKYLERLTPILELIEDKWGINETDKRILEEKERLVNHREKH